MIFFVKLEKIVISKVLQQKRALWPRSDLLYVKGSHGILCPGPRLAVGDAQVVQSQRSLHE